MDNANPHPSHKKLWEETLAQAALQNTRATFDTWLRGTKAVRLDPNGTLVVSTPNPMAFEWLDQRMKPALLRILEGIGHTGKLEFITKTLGVIADEGDEIFEGVEQDEEARRPPLSKAVLELMDFDPTTRGWQQLPSYAVQFWQPYLDLGPYNTWQTLRSFALMGGRWPSINTLADICCKGNKQVLIGRTYRGKYHPGWLETLEAEKIIWYKRRGNDYVFKILDRLPLLAPQQVAKLSKRRQKCHTDFLTQAHIDLKEWKQLTLASLSKGVKGG